MAVAAILDQVAQRDADLIVVGKHRSGYEERPSAALRRT